MGSIYQNYLFKAEAIKSHKTYNVYAINRENNITYFLFYINEEWKWADARLFRPAQYG